MRVPFVLISLVVVAVAAIVAAVVLSGSDRTGEPRFAVPELDVEPGTAVPHAGQAPSPPPDGVEAWADRLAAAVNVPARTLEGYVRAEHAVRAATPGCNLSWATLAGVGRVESDHGRYGGSSVGDDGKLTKPIIGVPLDGSPGVLAIKDTDGGVLDGDPTWDRAVGPMQFLPETWNRYATRAGADGARPDPQDVDDAALTAGKYLCATGGDLATGRGWWKAVLTYNDSRRYGRTVFSGADAYARKADELAAQQK